MWVRASYAINIGLQASYDIRALTKKDLN